MTDLPLGDDVAKASARKALAVLALAAVLLALGVSPHWRINPDSALYAGIADSAASGKGLSFAGEPQPSIPPAVPLYLSLAVRMARFSNPDAPVRDAFLYLNAFSAFLAAVGLVCAALLLFRLAPPLNALLALLFLAAARRYYEGAITPLTDVPYCAVSWAALYLLLRSEGSRSLVWPVAAAAALALAPLTRLVGIALLAAVAIYLAARALRAEKRQGPLLMLLVILPGAVVVALFVRHIMSARSLAAFNYYDDLIAGRTLADMLARAAADFRTLPSYIFETVFGLEALPGLGIAFTTFVAVGAYLFSKKRSSLPLIYCIVYLVFVSIGEEPRPRYIVPVLPFIYLFAIETARFSLASFSRRASALKTARALSCAVVFIIVATNLVFVAREIVLNFHAPFHDSYKSGKWSPYISLADSLRKAPPAGRIMTVRPRILHVLSGLPTAGLPYHPETSRRPSPADLRRYVDERSVSAIVVDPSDPESAALFADFAAQTAPPWPEKARFKELVLLEAPIDAP